MHSAVINIKTKPHTKEEAQQIADDLGVSLSALINGFLHTLVKTKTAYFSLEPDETPNNFMRAALQAALVDKREGKVSPRFTAVGGALQWLHKSAKKYAH